MRRRLSVRLRSDNPAGKGHFTILVVAPNPSSPASRGRITVYVPILCCVGRADPSRPHGLFSVTCIFFSTQRLTIQTGKLRDRTSWGTGGYPDEADTDRGHGRAHGHAYGVALCRKPRIGGRSSRARAGACTIGAGDISGSMAATRSGKASGAAIRAIRPALIQPGTSTSAAVWSARQSA